MELVIIIVAALLAGLVHYGFRRDGLAAVALGCALAVFGLAPAIFRLFG